MTVGVLAWLEVLCFTTAGSSPFVPTQAPNLNGLYLLSQTPGGNETQRKFPSQYREFPRGVRYFDVYSPPIETLYSQVFWKGLKPVRLPEEVVQRYANGGAMAVVGFELDQVRRTPDGDVSVPINVAYNHHFESTMVGAGVHLEKIHPSGPTDPRLPKHHVDMGHGVASEVWVPRDTNLHANGGLPRQQDFSAANGGEVRKSFHGFPPGYAQIIQSPEQLQITPMQIDTWHREHMNLTGSPFVSGPVPRNSLAPRDGPDALYSGLLECPVTTRLRKDIDAGYKTIAVGQCQDAIQTAAECFSAASRELGLEAQEWQQTNTTAKDSSQPSGCSAAVDMVARALVVTFNSGGTGDCGAHASRLVGVATSLVTLNVSLDLALLEATIVITGPADVWFGVGFNAHAMKDEPWAIIVEGDGAVSERKLHDQNPGAQLAKFVTIVSSEVVLGKRTVVLTRPMEGKSQDYFSFTRGESPALPFISAVGNSPTLSYHKIKTSSSIVILPAVGPSVNGVCVCASHPSPFGTQKGRLRYVPTSQRGEAGQPSVIDFSNRCAPPPRGSLLEQKNPTCDVRTYVGGQLACHHMFSLLDADQEIPWPDRPLNYSLKFRFWYQDYNESYHQPVVRTWGSGWDAGAGPAGWGAEYDVPKCMDGVAGCSRLDDGTWVHTITSTFVTRGTLVAAHMHCHAPACLSMAIYNNHTGKLICEQKSVFGGTGRIDERRFDEAGFILVPPCLWGSSEYGLEPPVDLSGTMVTIVKITNATYGHHGEMAHGQVFSLSNSVPAHHLYV
mmetsp:Transcript_48596/g.135802  ORF Transcript_48596/g.135802 Transcript_48596/m.135802 type:complete len:784 (-) Transcript_48596:90-2441(-)|eukprot:CAMPEP_0117463422 /NCGR_PEP_ID=MMETSP0784-20121206/3568_1 /TAXON_ID=39447 /ORGANISM="" /LENGTH=783 /DNA_ID=CAMNT_0005257231 /DNA_START=30 /DNA_END=2381 /DNA_ORIENTATION=+